MARKGRRRSTTWPLSWWYGSLYVRVVGTMVLVGLLVIYAVGTFMYQRIADGLVDTRTQTATQESAAGTRLAQGNFDGAYRNDQQNLTQLEIDTLRALASPGEDRSRRVLMSRSLSNPGTGVTLPTRSSDSTVDVSRVPEGLRRAIDATPGRQQVTIVQVPRAEGDPTLVPTVLVGARVEVPRAGSYDLYFFYPMQREEQTLSVVSQAFLFGGIAILVLLALLAFIVTRQVVEPVRNAATVAEDLARGRLERRMAVRGTDDLATLARSYNDMASTLQAKIAQLEQYSEAQQRFSSDVSHELRTPLTTIRMAADVLHGNAADFPPPLRRSVELLLKEVDRFQSLLADLLEISRFDAEAAALDSTTHDVRDLVREVTEALQPAAEEYGTPLQVKAPASRCVAEIDPRRVQRVLRNLLSNAIEHGERRPIDITVQQSARAVRIAVRDRGVGLVPGQETQVFERFWRADPSRKRTMGGTGLGLAISLEDARLHGGWLQAHAAEGGGAEFILTLPRRAGDPVEPVAGVPVPTTLVDAAARGGEDVIHGEK